MAIALTPVDNEWSEKIKNIFKYLLDNDYDFKNTKETQILTQINDCSFGSNAVMTDFITTGLVIKEKNRLINSIQSGVSGQQKKTSKI